MAGSGCISNTGTEPPTAEPYSRFITFGMNGIYTTPRWTMGRWFGRFPFAFRAENGDAAIGGP